MIARPTGVSMPPPTPCSTRNAINCESDWAAPQSADEPMNIANAKRNTRLLPIRSLSQPDAGMKTARLSV